MTSSINCDHSVQFNFKLILLSFVDLFIFNNTISLAVASLCLERKGLVALAQGIRSHGI